MSNTQNYLSFTDTKTVGNEVITVKIGLDDECKNGHADFSVTGEVYQKDKPRTDRNMISCGCVHDYILKAFPEFKQFVDLHLCDAKGAPMYPEANGSYFLKSTGSEEAREYVRATPAEWVTLSKAEDEIHFSFLLNELGIVSRWEQEAKAAIGRLEEMTGKTFVDESVRYQYTPLTSEQVKDLKKKIKSGYYTPEKLQEREIARIEGNSADRGKTCAGSCASNRNPGQSY